VTSTVRHSLTVAFVAYLAVLAVLVLDPSQEAPGQSLSLVSRVLDAVGLSVPVGSSSLEVASNVALFVPWGLLGLLLWPWLRVLGWTGAGAVVSVSIELSQLLFLPDRFATVSDLGANTAGALFGAVIATMGRRLLPGTFGRHL